MKLLMLQFSERFLFHYW